MSNPVLLNSEQHKRLRIKDTPMTHSSPSARNCAVVMLEFQRLAAHYPILFTKNSETGQFACVALFGFDEGENLLFDDHQWQVPYVPLNIRRQPFLVGTQNTPTGEQEHVVLLDIDDERVQEEEGEPLFNERGFPAPYMETITSILKTLKDGQEQTHAFIEQLLALKLIAPATFKIALRNGEQRQIEGLYTIDQERLNTLGNEHIVQMHQKGHLEAAYMMIASLGQVQNLIERKNRRT